MHSLVRQWLDGKCNKEEKDLSDDSSENSSCLSPSVHVMLKALHAEKIEVKSFLPGMYLSDYLPIKRFNDAQSEEENFLQACPELYAIANQVHDYFTNTTADQILQDYPEAARFLYPDWYRNLCELHQLGESMLSFQIGASMLDFNLLQVYLAFNSQCTPEPNLSPKKLSDLLQTAPLKLVIPSEILFILRLLIGPLSGLNIRNLLWHGFLTFAEFDEKLTSLLLFIIASVAKIVDQLTLQNPEAFRSAKLQLPKISYEISSSSVGIWLKASAEEYQEIHSCIDRSYFVPWTMRKEWHSVIEKIEQHKFYEALVLGLPLFESALRRVYVVENNCASRILTAENSQLFCTLDTILDPYADDKELNKLFAAFPPNANNFRDLLAHGHADPRKLSFTHAADFLSLFVVLCTKFSNSSLQPTSLQSLCFEWFDKFQPQYHLKFAAIETLLRSIALWKDTFSELQPIVETMVKDKQVEYESHVENIIGAVQSRIKKCFPEYSENILERKYWQELCGSSQFFVIPLPNRYEMRVGILQRTLESVITILELLKQAFLDLHQKVVARTAWKRNREAFALICSQMNWWESFVKVLLCIIIERLICSSEEVFCLSDDCVRTKLESDHHNEFSLCLQAVAGALSSICGANAWKRMKAVSQVFLDFEYEIFLQTGLLRQKDISFCQNKLSQYLLDIK